MMTSQLDVAALQRAVEAAWTRDTSSDPERWSSDNPAFGQCAVTALVMQDFLGGTLLRTVVGDISHYWNELPTGEELDLTRRQFGDHYVPEGREHRDRGYVLSYSETQRRYARLCERVADQLGESRGRGTVASSLHVEHP